MAKAKRTKKVKAVTKKAVIKEDPSKVETTPVVDKEAPEEAFVVPTEIVQGVKKPCLTEIDLLKLELMHEKIRRNAEGFRAKSLEADKYEQDANLKLRKMRQQAKTLEQERHYLNDDRIRLLNEMSDKYKINFKDPNLSYNTDTRIIEVPQEPFKREGQVAPEPSGDG